MNYPQQGFPQQGQGGYQQGPPPAQQPPPGYYPPAQQGPPPGYYPPAQQPPPNYGPPPGSYQPQYGAPQAPPPPPENFTLADFANQPTGGNGKAWSFASDKGYRLGTWRIGQVAREVSDADVEGQTMPNSNIPAVLKDGRRKLVLKVPLSVAPDDEFTDGRAQLYCSGGLWGELTRAMATAGAPAGYPEAGSVIAVRKTGERPIPGMSAAGVYEVQYQRPGQSGQALAQPPAQAQQAPQVTAGTTMVGSTAGPDQQYAAAQQGPPQPQYQQPAQQPQYAQQGPPQQPQYQQPPAQPQGQPQYQQGPPQQPQGPPPGQPNWGVPAQTNVPAGYTGPGPSAPGYQQGPQQGQPEQGDPYASGLMGRLSGGQQPAPQG